MKDFTPDFPPFTKRQLDRLEELKVAIEKREDHLSERIDELTRTVLRFVLKEIPKEFRGPSKLNIEAPTYGGRLLPGKHRLEIKLGFGDFRPDCPSWTKNHCVEWIQRQRGQKEGYKTLRKTKIVGIETGVKPPRGLRLFLRVLELRGFDGPDMSDSLGEDLDESLRIVVTDEMLRNAREQGKVEEKKKKRTRKEGQGEQEGWPWWRVIKKVVEEGLVEKVKTPLGEKNPSIQQFKKMLKNRYPEWPWEEV